MYKVIDAFLSSILCVSIQMNSCFFKFSCDNQPQIFVMFPLYYCYSKFMEYILLEKTITDIYPCCFGAHVHFLWSTLGHSNVN